MLIFISKITRSSLGPNVKNFVVELSDATLTATLKKRVQVAAHPKRALLTRSTGIIPIKGYELRYVQKTCHATLKESLWAPQVPKMSNRINVLSMIHTVMTKIKNASSREQRFNLLESAQILTDILQEVTVYENSLIMDLDVD